MMTVMTEQKIQTTLRLEVEGRVPLYVGSFFSQIELTVAQHTTWVHSLPSSCHANVEIVFDVGAAQELMNWLGKLGLKPEK
jgi:hypothetical protein